MKYRVSVRLAFDDKNIATNFLEVIKKEYLINAQSINESKDIKELSFCLIEECHHDETPPKACVIKEKWEVKLGVPTNTILING